MSLLQAWKTSFAVFLPTNLKLFLFITVKSAMQAIRSWLGCCWWLLALYIGINVASLGIYSYIMSYAAAPSEELAGYVKNVELLNGVLGYLALGIWILMVWKLFLAVRPSVTKKDCSYYLSYWYHGLWVLAVYALAYVGVSFLDNIYMMINYFKILGMSWSSAVVDTTLTVILGYVILPFIPFGQYLGTANALLYSPLLAVFIFRFLDTPACIKDVVRSLFHAFKLVLYTYPLLWVVVWVMTSLASLKTYAELLLVSQILGGSGAFPFVKLAVMDIVSVVLVLLLLVIHYSIIKVIYTKQVHEHFNRYF